MKFPQSSSQSMAAAALASFALIFLWPVAPAVNAQESFFKGKTIVVIQGRDPGGTGDLRVKALFPFLAEIYPGKPDYRERVYARRRQPKGGKSYLQIGAP